MRCREAITAVLPETELGELDGIKALPGMVGATADTLRKAWWVGVDLQARAGEHPRLQSIASLEAAVVETLPPVMMRPADLVAAGVARLDHAATLSGLSRSSASPSSRRSGGRCCTRSPPTCR